MPLLENKRLQEPEFGRSQWAPHPSGRVLEADAAMEPSVVSQRWRNIPATRMIP